MSKLNTKKNRGFTLLEVMVAITILMVAVVAPITIAQKGLSSASYTKNQMIGSYLAQDAIEFIKNMRDTNAINHGSDWADFINNEIPVCLVADMDEVADVNVPGCQIDVFNTEGDSAIKTYSSGNTLYKNIDTRNSNDYYGVYGYEDNPSLNYFNTGFTRQVKVLVDPYTDNPNEALVNVVVRWPGDPTNSNVNVSTLIYNF